MRFLIIVIVLAVLGLYSAYELETYFEKNYETVKRHKTEITVTEETKPYPNIIQPINSKKL